LSKSIGSELNAGRVLHSQALAEVREVSNCIVRRWLRERVAHSKGRAEAIPTATGAGEQAATSIKSSTRLLCGLNDAQRDPLATRSDYI
jgi:hypothetical protein